MCVSIRIGIACMFMLLGIASSGAQTVDKREAKSLLEELSARSGLQPNATLPALEGPIDPKKYIVGPSDVLSVAVWGPVQFSATLPVTPEGNLIIPTVGVLSVGGKPLEEVKNIVFKATKAEYLIGDVTTTLVAARTFVVTVTGNVMNPGQYQASPIDRVEKVVIQASRIFLPSSTVTIQAAPGKEERSIREGPYNDPRINQVAEIFGTISTRNIRVLRHGDTLRVDIPKYYATKDDKYNPFLLDADMIFVPRRVFEKNFIAVYGAVNSPGLFEYVVDDLLSDALLIAGGPTPNADLKSVKVVRMDELGAPAGESVLDLSAGSPDLNRKLLHGDRVVVGEKYDSRRDFRVSVGGEVRSPGYYPISKSGTKLSEVVKNAGGLTENALLTGALLLRKADKLTNVTGSEEDIARNLRAQDLSPVDSAYFFLNLTQGRPPVVVDFFALFARKDSSHDVLVYHDDIIYIPSNLYTVIVNGQVSNPGQIPFVAGADFRYYIGRAGGFSELALEGDSRIIKRATLEWVEPGKTSIEPGDQIWVPRKVRRDFRHYFDYVKDIIAVTAGVATTLLLFIQINR
jgi:polysaccharide export outer membrane protein